MISYSLLLHIVKVTEAEQKSTITNSHGNCWVNPVWTARRDYF